MAANVGARRSAGGGRAGSGSVAATATAVCRPSGARWTPTPEQIRILKELYDGCGIRSPNSEQIQRITAMLREHGKIEGKNVFYLFQNHKAHERQKRRLTNLDINVPAGGGGGGNHLGILSLSSPSGAAPPSPTLGFYAGDGANGSAVLLDTSSDCGSSMATETCFLQDYMGVTMGTGTASQWPCFSSSSETDTTMAWAPTAATRAPETLPLFLTGGGVSQPLRPRPRHGVPVPVPASDQAIRGGSSSSSRYLPFWGAAPTTASATSVAIQQQHQLQEQYYSFYSNTTPGTGSQDASSSAAVASLELSLSSWFSCLLCQACAAAAHRCNAVKVILPLEHALSSGSAIRSHVELLRTSVEGLGKDSLSELALSSLREDDLDYGSDIRMELKQRALLSEADEAEHKPLPRLLQDKPDVSKDTDKYEKELKDNRSRELKYAEEAVILNKLMDCGGRYGGSKKSYCVAGGLHGVGLFAMKVAVTMAVVFILAQPANADRFDIFGVTSYTLHDWDLSKPYQDFYSGTFRSSILANGPKLDGLNVMRFPQRTTLPPRDWIAVEVKATGIDDDRTTLAIRDDNLYITGFANKFDEWFCFANQQAVLGCDQAHVLPFTDSYGANGLMSASLRTEEPDKPDTRAKRDMLSLVLGQDATIYAMLNLSKFNLDTSNLEHARLALRVLIVQISEAQRFKKISGPILENWPRPFTLSEVRFIWCWSDISCSMIVYKKKGTWPAKGVDTNRMKNADVTNYEQASEIADLVQLSFPCLKANGLKDDFKPSSPPSPAPV